jgi:hypothetical protein
MSPSDIVIATLFYQFSIYVCVRLARRGFTLGELAVVCNGDCQHDPHECESSWNQMCCMCQGDRCRSESYVYPTSRLTDFRRHS